MMLIINLNAIMRDWYQAQCLLQLAGFGASIMNSHTKIINDFITIVIFTDFFIHRLDI